MKNFVHALFALLLATGAMAQEYPSRAVKLVVPLTAGSGPDVLGRLLAQKLSDQWAQPVVVENRPGAGGTVGTAAVAKALPDGYTLLVSGSSHAVNAALYSNLPYDPLNDLVEVAGLAVFPQALLVAPSSGFRTLAELIAAARARPGQLSFASPGIGTGNHLAAEKLRLKAGIDVLHVPYKGGPEALADVVAGRATFVLNGVGPALPLIQSGKLIALGVSTLRPVDALPGVPPIAEAGVPGFSDALWFGVWAPAGTPRPLLEKVAGDASRALQSEDMKAHLKKLSAEPLALTLDEFRRFVRAEVDSATSTVRAAGIRPQ